MKTDKTKGGAKAGDLSVNFTNKIYIYARPLGKEKGQGGERHLEMVVIEPVNTFKGRSKSAARQKDIVILQ